MASRKKGSGRRRGRGEGTVFQLPAGQWACVISLGKTSAGKRKRKWFRGETAAQVRAKRDEFLGKQKAGMLADGEKTTLGAFLEHWLTNVSSKKRAGTCQNRETIVRLHIQPHLGPVALGQLTLPVLDAWQADLARTASVTTLRAAGAVLKTALRYALRARMLTHNPAQELQLPTAPETRIEVFSLDECETFLAVANQHRLSGLFALAVHSGMRQGELFALHWPAVNFSTNTVDVRSSLRQANDGTFFVEPPKSKRSRRTIHLPALAMLALRKHKAKMATEGRDVDTGPVFLTRNGTFFSRSNFVRYTWRSLLRKADLGIRKFHTLRHTHASLLLANGVNIKAISERLGHHDAAFTLRVYAHLMPGADQETARVIDRLFASNG